jgi:hypothetical protein
LRAKPSQAAEIALPCANPHMEEAMAMAKPAVMTFHATPPP